MPPFTPIPKDPLIVGAQENLQRQYLDLVEEAQLVAWHERMFTDKNQSKIGAILGRSSDWVSTRSRIHRLPRELKERLRQRPRVISQMLELGKGYLQQPELATSLAERVVREELTLDQLRSFIRGYSRPERRGTATPVQEITSSERSSRSSDCEEENDYRDAAINAPAAGLAAPLLATAKGGDQAAMAEASTISVLSPDSLRQGDFINLSFGVSWHCRGHFKDFEVAYVPAISSRHRTVRRGATNSIFPAATAARTPRDHVRSHRIRNRFIA